MYIQEIHYLPCHSFNYQLHISLPVTILYKSINLQVIRTIFTFVCVRTICPDTSKYAIRILFGHFIFVVTHVLSVYEKEFFQRNDVLFQGCTVLCSPHIRNDHQCFCIHSYLYHKQRRHY